MLKKMMLFTAALVLLLSVPLQANASQKEIAVYLDGMNMEFAAAPQLINGSTMVPMRTIFENLGATVKWDDSTYSVTAIKEDTVIKLTIGSTEASRNEERFSLSVAPIILNNTTYVPLRFVSEALNTEVGWISRPNTVTINSSKLREFQVQKVRDGDTIEGFYIDDPIHELNRNSGQLEIVRFIGVDTPETVKEGTPVQFWGPEASNYTKDKLNGKRVYIAEDKNKDPYGRTLAYVFLEDGTFFNAELVSGGYARALAIEPNTRWKDLFSYLESDAKANKRGLWSETTGDVSTDPIYKKYLEEQAAKYGFRDGEFHPEELVTKEQLLKYLIIALFPEAKTIFMAKSFYDLSQDEQFRQIIAYAIDSGLILKDEIINQNEPLTLKSAVTIISRALQLDDVGHQLTLSDFGIYLDQTNMNAPLTMEDALLLIEKTKKVYGPLMEYFAHMTEAVKNSEIIEKLSASLSDQKLRDKLREYVSNVKGIVTDPDLLTTVKTTGSDLLSGLKTLITGGWKDLMNLKNINDAIQQTNENLNDAEEALNAAQEAN